MFEKLLDKFTDEFQSHGVIEMLEKLVDKFIDEFQSHGVIETLEKLLDKFIDERTTLPRICMTDAEKEMKTQIATLEEEDIKNTEEETDQDPGGADADRRA